MVRDAEMVDAQATIARQADELACLRALVRELAERLAAGGHPSAPVDELIAATPTSGIGWSALPVPTPLRSIEPGGPFDRITPAWAWGDGTGRGVRVAVVDSGIDAAHPAIGRRVAGYLSVTNGPDGLVYDTAPHGDANGHGTACASIIRALAPECELYSIRVLGPLLQGTGAAFVGALRWAIDNGMQVCNLSLGAEQPELFGPLHRLADLAYFRNVALVAAAPNEPVASFPSAFASVISVAAHDGADRDAFYYNPAPPVEIGAPGTDVRVAWRGRGWRTVSGNSFAAPYITGLAARILGRHPELTPFQLKSVLHGLATNVQQC